MATPIVIPTKGCHPCSRAEAGIHFWVFFVCRDAINRVSTWQRLERGNNGKETKKMSAAGEEQHLAVSDKLRGIQQQARDDLRNCRTNKEVEAVRVRILGKKGTLSQILHGIGQLPQEKRREVGKEANVVRADINALIAARLQTLGQQQLRSELQQHIDISLPGRRLRQGSLHPITQTGSEILRCMRDLGFVIVDGPEVEHDFLNFTALNVPPDHPARQMQDTLYLSGQALLRTHTSPVQIRVLAALSDKKQPRLQVASLGKAYRRDAVDATHLPMFHQVEALYVAPDATFAQLKTTLNACAKRLFSHDTRVRIRPSYFPFTEPSFEVDVSCPCCTASGCRVCKSTGWVEIMGAGMVDPAVFQTVGMDPETVRGFAFGMGVERVTMMCHGIRDIRLLYDNDVRFLRQF
ncbi:MAG: phenylalanine--tRNA ligase subunit alpha [Myxococcota bacterium]